MSAWMLQQESKTAYRLTNTSGGTLTNITVRLAGAVVAGIHGSRQWETGASEVEDGDYLEIRPVAFNRNQHANDPEQRPRLVVTFDSATSAEMFENHDF